MIRTTVLSFTSIGRQDRQPAKHEENEPRGWPRYTTVLQRMKVTPEGAANKRAVLPRETGADREATPGDVFL